MLRLFTKKRLTIALVCALSHYYTYADSVLFSPELSIISDGKKTKLNKKTLSKLIASGFSTDILDQELGVDSLKFIRSLESNNITIEDYLLHKLLKGRFSSKEEPLVCVANKTVSQLENAYTTTKPFYSDHFSLMYNNSSILIYEMSKGTVNERLL